MKKKLVLYYGGASTEHARDCARNIINSLVAHGISITGHTVWDRDGAPFYIETPHVKIIVTAEHNSLDGYHVDELFSYDMNIIKERRKFNPEPPFGGTLFAYVMREEGMYKKTISYEPIPDDISNLNTLSKYEYDVREYMYRKLPDVPTEVIMEISAYISNRTGVLVGDICLERDKEWNKTLHASHRR